MVSLYFAWIYFMFVQGYSDANSGDQNSSTQSRTKQRESIESNNGNRGDKAKDFAESNSSGVKYSVQAKVPVTCVGKRGQLVSNN
jgi:hypothetical protein